MFHMLQWLYTYVASVYSKYFICFSNYVTCEFIWMLHMFHTYVVSVLSGRCICFSMAFQVFLQVFQTHVLSVSSVFTCMLQIFHLDVIKTNRVLLLGTHLPQEASERGSRVGVSSLRVESGPTGDVRTVRVPTWPRETEGRRGCPDAAFLYSFPMNVASLD